MDKTRDERIKELLDGSAKDAADAIKGPSLADVAQDSKEDVKEDAPEETDSGGKKVRIPASRLKTLTSKVNELEAKLQESQTYAERVAALEAQLRESRNSDDDLPDWWKDSYGDDENSRKGYKNQQRIFREEMTREFERREADRMAQEAERAERIESIENSFDQQMDELEETIGRELTDTQKSELLDIVGEYSPQEDGKYLAYMPVDKAYEIWQHTQTQSPAKQEMARIAGISSSGSASPESSKERPQWGDWRKRF